MAEDMWQQIEGILWDDSCSQYKEACLKEDWRQAHELLRDFTLKIVERCKQQTSLIKEYKEAIERYEEAIDRCYHGLDGLDDKMAQHEATLRRLMAKIEERAKDGEKPRGLERAIEVEKPNQGEPGQEKGENQNN